MDDLIGGPDIGDLTAFDFLYGDQQNEAVSPAKFTNLNKSTGMELFSVCLTSRRLLRGTVNLARDFFLSHSFLHFRYEIRRRYHSEPKGQCTRSDTNFFSDSF